MEPVTGKKRTNQIIKLLIDNLAKCTYVTEAEWSNREDTVKGQTYKIDGSRGSVLATEVAWVNSGTGIINRRGIMATVYEGNANKKRLSQIFEMTLPYGFSKRFNTRVYEEDGKVEIRNYGRFTIGSKGLKRSVFFDFLRENGYGNEICYDDENIEYLKVLEIKEDHIQYEDFCERITLVTHIVYDYKNYCRKNLV